MKKALIFFLSFFFCANMFAQDWCFYQSGKELGRGNLLAYLSDRDALKKCTLNCEVIVQSYAQNASDAWNITKKKWYKYKIKTSGTFWNQDYVMYREIEVSVVDDPEQPTLKYIMRYDSNQKRWFVREPNYYDGTKLRELGRAEGYCVTTAFEMFLTRRHFLDAIDSNNSAAVREKQKNICKLNNTWIDN